MELAIAWSIALSIPVIIRWVLNPISKKVGIVITLVLAFFVIPVPFMLMQVTGKVADTSVVILPILSYLILTWQSRTELETDIAKKRKELGYD